MKKYISRIFVIVVVVVIALGLGFYSSSVVTNYDDVEITAKKDERLMKRNAHFVYAKDQNGKELVFQNTNNNVWDKNNADDIAQQLEVGKHYQITTKGMAIFTQILPFGENITEVEEIK